MTYLWSFTCIHLSDGCNAPMCTVDLQFWRFGADLVKCLFWCASSI